MESITGALWIRHWSVLAIVMHMTMKQTYSILHLNMLSELPETIHFLMETSALHFLQ